MAVDFCGVLIEAWKSQKSTLAINTLQKSAMARVASWREEHFIVNDVKSPTRKSGSVGGIV